MKKLFIAGFVILSFSLNSLAMWALIPTSEVVKDSDLIVIGTLELVSEYTKDNIDYSEGTIVIEKVIAGKVKTVDEVLLKSGDKIKLKWQNSSMIICPRVEHRGAENQKGFWLLEIEEDGTVSSDYPWRFRTLKEIDDINKALQTEKVRQTSRKVKLLNEPFPDQTNHSTQAFDTIQNKPSDSIKAAEVYSNSSKAKYSPFSALLMALSAAGLYWLLYRSRFKIR